MVPFDHDHDSWLVLIPGPGEEKKKKRKAISMIFNNGSREYRSKDMKKYIDFYMNRRERRRKAKYQSINGCFAFIRLI